MTDILNMLSAYSELAGLVIGFFLTVCVLSFVFGDNDFFRFAVHIFIGVSAGYATVIVVYNVIWQRLLLPLAMGKFDMMVAVAPPLLGGLWLLAKLSRVRWLSNLANPVMAYLVGAAAATAIGGAILGTLYPQAMAATDYFDLTKGVMVVGTGALLLLGTISTLVYFHFGARQVSDRTIKRAGWIEALASLGQVFIAITLGALFAAVFTAALTAFVERLGFLWIVIKEWLLPNVIG
jgi:hypothetical protein